MLSVFLAAPGTHPGAVILLFALYFTPSIVAAIRHHHQLAPIVVINFFLGWTILGWIGCLAWSVSAIRRA